LPAPLKHFQSGRFGGEAAQASLHILYPPDGARLDMAHGGPDTVPLKVTGAVAPLTVLVNGVPVEKSGQGIQGTLSFKPNGQGFSRVTVIDSIGGMDSVTVRVDDGSTLRGIVRTVRAGCSISPCQNKPIAAPAQ
jgi:penicillin-binding protein 1C